MFRLAQQRLASLTTEEKAELMLEAARWGDYKAISAYYDYDEKMLAALTPDGSCVLHIAAERGHLKTIKHLIQNKYPCPVHHRLDKKSPIDVAAEHGHLNIVKFIIEEHAERMKPSKGKRGETSILRFFQDYTGNEGAVLEAVVHGRLDILKYLRSKGDQFEARPQLTHKYTSAVAIAHLNKRKKIIKYLRGQNALCKFLEDELELLNYRLDLNYTEAKKYIAENNYQIGLLLLYPITEIYSRTDRFSDVKDLIALCHQGIAEQKNAANQTPLKSSGKAPVITPAASSCAQAAVAPKVFTRIPNFRGEAKAPHPGLFSHATTVPVSAVPVSAAAAAAAPVAPAAMTAVPMITRQNLSPADIERLEQIKAELRTRMQRN